MLEYLAEQKEIASKKKRFASDGYKTVTMELAEKMVECTDDELDALAYEMLLNTKAFINSCTECNRSIEYYEKEISKNETV